MGIRINFEEGNATIASEYEYMFTMANDIISDSMKHDCMEILQMYPWEHLKNYLQQCYGQMMGELPRTLRDLLEEFVNSEGGFISFARNTLNSEAAVEYASHITDRLLECPDYYLGGTEMYLEEMGKISTEHSSFEDGPVAEKLTAMFKTGLARAEEQRTSFGNRIAGYSEENQFVAPLLAVPEILFGLIGAWYEQLLNSVPVFIDGANENIQNSTSITRDYSANAGQQAQGQAQSIAYHVEG